MFSSSVLVCRPSSYPFAQIILCFIIYLISSQRRLFHYAFRVSIILAYSVRLSLPFVFVYIYRIVRSLLILLHSHLFSSITSCCALYSLRGFNTNPNILRVYISVICKFFFAFHYFASLIFPWLIPISSQFSSIA